MGGHRERSGHVKQILGMAAFIGMTSATFMVLALTSIYA